MPLTAETVIEGGGVVGRNNENGPPMVKGPANPPRNLSMKVSILITPSGVAAIPDAVSTPKPPFGFPPRTDKLPVPLKVGATNRTAPPLPADPLAPTPLQPP